MSPHVTSTHLGTIPALRSCSWRCHCNVSVRTPWTGRNGRSWSPWICHQRLRSGPLASTAPFVVASISGLWWQITTHLLSHESQTSHEGHFVIHFFLMFLNIKLKCVNWWQSPSSFLKKLLNVHWQNFHWRNNITRVYFEKIQTSFVKTERQGC